jgi:transcription elongation factor GreA
VGEEETEDTAGEAITAEGLKELEADLARMEGPDREAMAERLKVARALGDLKENAEYHIAKEDQAHLETRIKRARERLNRAVVVDPVSDEADLFSFGRSARITDADGKVHEWKLVGSTEADLSRGMLSVESPIGIALRGARVGEQVVVETPGGTRKYRIEEIL